MIEVTSATRSTTALCGNSAAATRSGGTIWVAQAAPIVSPLMHMARRPISEPRCPKMGDHVGIATARTRRDDMDIQIIEGGWVVAAAEPCRPAARPRGPPEARPGDRRWLGGRSMASRKRQHEIAPTVYPLISIDCRMPTFPSPSHLDPSPLAAGTRGSVV